MQWADLICINLDAGGHLRASISLGCLRPRSPVANDRPVRVVNLPRLAIPLRGACTRQRHRKCYELLAEVSTSSNIATPSAFHQVRVSGRDHERLYTSPSVYSMTLPSAFAVAFHQ